MKSRNDKSSSMTLHNKFINNKKIEWPVDK